MAGRLVQEDNGKARVLRATGGLVQEVTEHEQVVYGTRALDREPEKNDMGVKQKAMLRSPLDYDHGAGGTGGVGWGSVFVAMHRTEW